LVRKRPARRVVSHQRRRAVVGTQMLERLGRKRPARIAVSHQRRRAVVATQMPERPARKRKERLPRSRPGRCGEATSTPELLVRNPPEGKVVELLRERAESVRQCELSKVARRITGSRAQMCPHSSKYPRLECVRLSS